MKIFIKRSLCMIMASALLIVLAFNSTSSFSINNKLTPLIRSVKLETLNVENLSKITPEDLNHVAELYQTFKEDEPNATEIEKNNYLLAEMHRLCSEKSIDEVAFNLPYTTAEIALIALYPAQALEVNSCSIIARTAAEIYYESGLNLGNGNAFKHGFWNALMVKRVGITIAELFATAHEYGKPDNAETQMDLKNNNHGRIFGASNTHLEDVDLGILIKNYVTAGMFWRCINGSNGYLAPTNGEGLRS